MAFKIFLIIFLLISYLCMLSLMIIFERDKPRSIFIWSVIFLFTQIVGYIVYVIFKIVYLKRKKILKIKSIEDEIYLDLSNKKIVQLKQKINDDLLEFSSRSFNSQVRVNNDIEFITNYDEFKNSLKKDISSANKFIFFEFDKINKKDFFEIATLLTEKAEEGVTIKCAGNCLPHKIKKLFNTKKVKFYKFKNSSMCSKSFANKRNVISIDGKVIYLSNLDNSDKKLTFDNDFLITKLRGQIVQDVNLKLYEDVIFASGKYMEYQDNVENSFNNNNIIEYVTNDDAKNIELLLIKAICTAKKSIRMELREFAPNETIMSLLKYAVNSNIKVELIIPIKTKNYSRYYAYRAFAKELALSGAGVYLYDGYINFNAIIIDKTYVLTGSFVMDKGHINKSLQNILIIKDEKSASLLNKKLDLAIDNSYQINDARFLILREKFCKNFI